MQSCCSPAKASQGNGKVSLRKLLLMTSHAGSSFNLKKEKWEGEEDKRKSKREKKEKRKRNRKKKHATSCSQC